MESKTTGTFANVKKGKILVDFAYQRRQDSQRKKQVISKIVKNFSWPKFGSIDVAVDENGDMFCIDGAGRLTAANRIPEIEEVPCMIFEDLSQMVQADIFKSSAVDRVSMAAIDKYKAGYIAGELSCIRLKHIIGILNREVSKHGGPGSVSCVEDLMRRCESETLFSQLERLCPIIREICNGHILDGRIVKGLAFLDSSIGGLSEQQKERLLSKGYKVLLRSLLDQCAETARTGSRIYAIGITKAHNLGLRSNRISLDRISHQDEK